jgi:hypothetical protein
MLNMMVTVEGFFFARHSPHRSSRCNLNDYGISENNLFLQLSGITYALDWYAEKFKDRGIP